MFDLNFIARIQHHLSMLTCSIDLDYTSTHQRYLYHRKPTQIPIDARLETLSGIQSLIYAYIAYFDLDVAKSRQKLMLGMNGGARPDFRDSI